MPGPTTCVVSAAPSGVLRVSNSDPVKSYSTSQYPESEADVGVESGQVVHSAAGDSDFSRGDLGSRVTTWMRRIRFHDDKHGWIVGGFGLIMYTDDGGETWFRRLG